MIPFRWSITPRQSIWYIVVNDTYPYFIFSDTIIIIGYIELSFCAGDVIMYLPNVDCMTLGKLNL